MMGHQPVSVALALLLCVGAASAAPPTLLSPPDKHIFYCGRDGATPRFSWAAGGAKATDNAPDLVVEISSSRNFTTDVHRDAVPAILSRYVRAQPLAFQPKLSEAIWFWRVGAAAAGGNGTLEWSAQRSFAAVVPALRAMVAATTAGWAAIQAVLAAAAAARQPYLVEFAPAARAIAVPNGTAACGGPHCSCSFVNFTGAADVIVDGGGSALTFSDFVTFVSLHNCSRISVQNFAFDFAPLPYTALHVDAVAKQGSQGYRVANVSLLPGHPTLEELYGNPLVHEQTKAGVYSAGSAAQDGEPSTKRGAPEVISFETNWTRLGPDRGGEALQQQGNASMRYAVAVSAANAPWQQHGDLSAGDVLVLDPRIAEGFVIYVSQDVTLRGLNVFACSNECFTSEHAENLAILGCGTRVKPGRFLGANNGGHNHHGAAVGQWVEGGTWENAGDDTIHVSGLVMSVDQQSGCVLMLAPSYPDSVAVRQPMFNHYLGVRVGDVLQFFDRQKGMIISQRTVVSLTAPSAQGGGTTEVTLDAPPDAITTGRIGGGPLNASVTQVFNFNRTSNQFVFRKNRVVNGRRVGVLYKGHRAWVDSNEFVGLGGGALECWNAPYEGLLASTLLFRNNSVRDVCQMTSARVAAPIWTATFAPKANASRHGDLMIQRNTFDSGPGPTFLLSDVQGATIRDNDISYCEGDQVLTTSNVQGVTMHNNTKNGSSAPRLCSNTSLGVVKTDDEPLTAADGLCREDDDCNGGSCQDAGFLSCVFPFRNCHCECPPIWAGERCETLRLQPAKLNNGLRLVNTTTWGGGIGKDAAGKWHMYAARMVNGCGLKSWTSNSEIVHALSASVDGPFKVFGAPVYPTFAHNPTVQRVSKSGEWIMGMIGCGSGTKAPRAGCSNGTTCNSTWCEPSSGSLERDTTAVLSSTRGPRAQQHSCDNPHWTGISTAKEVGGPWSRPAPSQATNVQVPAREGGSWHSGGSVTNPSFWPIGNGSVYMAYSTGCANCSVSPGHKHIGVAFGLHATGPFVDLTPEQPIFPFASEDPCLFLDTSNANKGDVPKWHIFTHTDYTGVAENGTWAHVSAHAVAHSPWHAAAGWKVLDVPPYTRSIAWAGGQANTTVRTRERPQVIFDKGLPVALSNGVQPGQYSSPWTSGWTGDWSYTHVQKIGTKKN